MVATRLAINVQYGMLMQFVALYITQHPHSSRSHSEIASNHGPASVPFTLLFLFRHSLLMPMRIFRIQFFIILQQKSLQCKYPL